MTFLRLPGPSGGLPGIAGAVPGGGLGAEALGGFGAETLRSPGSDRYEDSAFAPVSTPPLLFFNLGIPPAKSPPSWGAPSDIAIAVDDPWSLLLRARLPGTGGASPPGGLDPPPMPGIGGAPPAGGPDDEEVFPAMVGADRSFVTAFFKALPFCISPNKAP